jgi:hypothetical protein
MFPSKSSDVRSELKRKKFALSRTVKDEITSMKKEKK